MLENKEIIDKLETRLDDLVKTQVDFQKEILQIRAELAALRGPSQVAPPPPRPPVVEPPKPVISAPPPSDIHYMPRQAPPIVQQPPPFSNYGRPGDTEPPPRRPPVQPRAETYRPPVSTVPPPPKQKSDFEKFIGENLLSKIAIGMLIIGVGIGAKYAIDNGWITPVMRIVFGYGIGAALVGLGLKLKAKYLSFSAVLLGGGMAIMYFITYFAYSLYELIPQPAAFVLMLVFTGFTVGAALLYNRQAIAHIGLVGAYAVPFLLSNNSGNYAFLFTYIAIVNVGIVAISIRKYWKPLIYTSFIFTWSTYLGWYATKYDPDAHFSLGLIFLGVFFSIFYLTTTIQHQLFESRTGLDDLAITIFDLLFFYGFGLSFLVGTTDDIAIVLGYVAAFTVFILSVSVRDYRRPLLIASFVGSWLTYLVFFALKYKADEHFSLAVVFLCIDFAIFYLAGLLHSAFIKEKAVVENIAPILTNSLIFYGFGYALLHRRPEFAGLMGLFTVGHAGLHFMTANITHRVKAFPVEITYLLTVLVITFITIAVPVQFDGHVITLVWSVEAALLFAFGRIKQVRIFEILSYPLMILATGSLAFDWIRAASERIPGEVLNFERPFSNGNFLSALIFVAALTVIYYIDRERERIAAIPENNRREVRFIIALIGLAALFNTFRIEIDNVFHSLSVARIVEGGDSNFSIQRDITFFNIVAQIDYTLLFLSVLSLINIYKVKSRIVAYGSFALNALGIGLFSTVGLFVLMELRESYTSTPTTDLLGQGAFHIAVRYISYIFIAALFFASHRYTKQKFVHEEIPQSALALVFDIVFYTSLLIIVSSELVNIMALNGYNDSYKLGLSILWGVYALFLVVLGIFFKDKKHLRIGAIILFALTLVKLFFYDITQLSTIAKTAVFVSLGVLMLIVSFLYTKYKNLIFGSEPVATDERAAEKLE